MGDVFTRRQRQSGRGCMKPTALDRARLRELVRVCTERGHMPRMAELATLFSTSRHNAYEVLYRLEALGLIELVPATFRVLVDLSTLDESPAATEVG